MGIKQNDYKSITEEHLVERYLHAREYAIHLGRLVPSDLTCRDKPIFMSRQVYDHWKNQEYGAIQIEAVGLALTPYDSEFFRHYFCVAVTKILPPFEQEYYLRENEDSIDIFYPQRSKGISLLMMDIISLQGSIQR